jgi:catechol 2,3-dioxygenase-like lactoylglutathione lyase family enzyme
MAPTEYDAARSTPPWQGFHHVTLLTCDLDATTRFYEDVLGMTVHGFDATSPLGRHCMISPGAGEARGIHFIEMRDARLGTQPDALRGARPYIIEGAFQHVSFALPDETAALALQARLRERGITMTEMIPTGPICNLMFSDNNGILLEASWPRGSQ